jgi:hypothetical protein
LISSTMPRLEGKAYLATKILFLPSSHDLLPALARTRLRTRSLPDGIGGTV